MIEFKVIARLMDYPTAEVYENVAELKQILLESPTLGFKLKARLENWLTEFEAGDLMDIQETYGGLFDRGRATSLLLFYRGGIPSDVVHREAPSRLDRSARCRMVALAASVGGCTQHSVCSRDRRDTGQGPSVLERQAMPARREIGRDL